MASASGSGDGAVAPPAAAPAPADGLPAEAGGGEVGPDDASLADRWGALRAAEVAARSTRASAALAARGPEEGVDPARPVPPALPTDVWALVLDRAASCRCASVPLSRASLIFPLLGLFFFACQPYFS